ncbi:hypothetical protein CFC21_012360 [Triticum aestivum]|uniref:F-box domain-containing protein n=3 Tax=Triticinae TaxID=1648030 RepID=A0A9R1IX24_WHEAT|nr:uncharacterized protein LOC123169969 [Triticum aestivum]KAF6995942.1 hypothetical protein CFC21_012360 [Triticum aestivum]
MMAPEPAVLPDDALAEVLRRLAPHVLAAARRVCKAWRDTVDACLRGSLLSRSVRGIFINFTQHSCFSEFFSRPSTGPAICGGLDFLPCMGVQVTGHCNGLLLCGERMNEDRALPREYVVNPATRRWARLPRRPPPHMPGFDQTAYLAFDPAVSTHYQVFLIPRLPAAGESDDDDDESEWPPASYVMHVFSSVTQRWDEKTFLREGEAAGIVGNMDSDLWYNRHRYHAVYWQSTLYIHCQHGYLARMSLSDLTYTVIKLPGACELRGYPNHHLGRSLGGVYCAIHDGWNQLQFWYLNESCGQIEWVLKHDTFLGKAFEREDYARQLAKRWILQDVNYRKWSSKYPEDAAYTRHANYKAPVEEKYDWNSDEDNVLDIEDDVQGGCRDNYYFLGFHPCKEVVFLISSGISARGLAYDWNNSKFQDLGTSCLADYDPFNGRPCGQTDSSFPYTPCWMGEFAGNELESLLEDEKLYRKKLEQKSQRKEKATFTFMDEYDLRKHRGHTKRVKDSNAKNRRRRRMAAW